MPLHDAARRVLRLTARVEIVGVNPFVLVKGSQAAALQPRWRKPMPVVVVIEGPSVTSWRTNMMPTGGGDFRLYLHGEMRKASGTTVGDMVTVVVGFDDEYRNGPLGPVPEWFRAALDGDAHADASWRELTPSRQKEIVRYFSNLKSEEAKRRNLARMMRILGGDDDHFMGRDWTEGK